MLVRSLNIQPEWVRLFSALEGVLLLLAVIVLCSAVFFTTEDPAPVEILPTAAPVLAIRQDLLLQQAQVQMNAGAYEDSLLLLNITIDLSSQPSAEMFALRADAYRHMRQYTSAINDYRQALAYNPANPLYYSGLCSSAAEMGDFAAAEAACDEAIRQRPDLVSAWNDRCYLRAYHLGDYPGAISDCERAIIIQPDHPYPYNNRARAWLMLGSYQQAIIDATYSLELGNPYPAFPLANRGTAALALGDSQTALADYQAALAADPHYAETYIRLGEMYRSIGQAQPARDAYCRYLTLAANPLPLAQERIQELGGCPAQVG